MRKLVSDELPAVVRGRIVSTGAEIDVSSDREGPGPKLARRLSGGWIGVDEYAAENMTETRLEKTTARSGNDWPRLDDIMGRVEVRVGSGATP